MLHSPVSANQAVRLHVCTFKYTLRYAAVVHAKVCSSVSKHVSTYMRKVTGTKKRGYSANTLPI